MTYNYDQTRLYLVQALNSLERARRVAVQVNLPPSMAPGDIRAQIDKLDDLLMAARDELEKARDACAMAGRRGLGVV